MNLPIPLDDLIGDFTFRQRKNSRDQAGHPHPFIVRYLPPRGQVSHAHRTDIERRRLAEAECEVGEGAKGTEARCSAMMGASYRTPGTDREYPSSNRAAELHEVARRLYAAHQQLRPPGRHRSVRRHIRV